MTRRWVTAHGRRFEVETLEIPGATLTILPSKKPKRDKFAMFPMLWWHRLNAEPAASGTVWSVATYILYLDWKENVKPFSGEPFKLPNKSLQMHPASKWRALADLERRKLITVERRNGKSPLIRLLPGE
jgi:hypothetical protein